MIRRALLLALVGCAFAALSDERTDLVRLREELAAKRAEVSRLTGRERDVVSRLSALDEQLTLSRRLVAKLDRERSRLGVEVDSLSSEERAAAARIERKQSALAERVRHMYRIGRHRGLRVLLEASSVSDLVRRVRFLVVTAKHDERMVRRVRAERAALAELRGRRQARLAEVAALAVEARTERDRQTVEQAEHKKLLTRIRSQKKLYESAIAELEASAKRIEAMIAERATQRAEQRAGGPTPGRRPRVALPDPPIGPGGSFVSRKGKLPWPARGRVLSNFGPEVHPQFRTTTFNSGIDIGVPRGTPVQSVCDGVVAFTGWLGGYGQFVIVEHAGGYYTLYGHLAEISVREGMVVAEKQVIGASGESGSLDGPKLHFEVRNGRDPVNPAAWLSR